MEEQSQNKDLNNQIDKLLNQKQNKVKQNQVHQKLAIVQELQTNGFQNLEKYQVIFRRGKKHPNLIQFHYHQFASFADPICSQARGIILDQKNNFAVVSLPYYKFFDYDDTKYSQLKQFDFSNYQIFEKHDGSIAMLYFYENEWHVSSARIPDGQSSYCFMNKQTTTKFNIQFWTIFKEMGYDLPSQEDKNKTFVFELMSKNHIVVVKRQKSQIVLHGVRNIDTLQEENIIPYCKKYHWKPAQNIKLEIDQNKSHISQIVEAVEKYSPIQHEGFVLVDHKFTRLKVKGSGYLKISYLDNLNGDGQRNPNLYVLQQIVLTGEAQNFCKYLPEWEKTIVFYQQKLKDLNAKVCTIFNQICHLQGKQFSAEVVKQDKLLHSMFYNLKKDKNLFYGKIEHSTTPKNLYKLFGDPK